MNGKMNDSIQKNNRYKQGLNKYQNDYYHRVVKHARVDCPVCGASIIKRSLKLHQKSDKCLGFSSLAKQD